jgi:mRNA-degrading endonuclease RelE of RelBE toxin-antitoxin system
MELIESLKPRTINYIGPSMNPILKPGDRLKIISHDLEKIRVGDVVIFYSPEDETKVVHRVVSVSSNGIKTRGDNCDQVDPWILRRDQILGRVVYAQRGKGRWRVFGGPLGHSLAVAIFAIKSIDSNLTSLLRPFYQRLARAGVFRRWLPAWMKTRAISLSHPAGTELQLLMGRRVIGRWLPGNTRWHIRRPFRLFVDEESLPENPAKGSIVPPEADQLSVANEDI